MRRIVIWNVETGKRPVCVTNVADDEEGEDAIFLGKAMLGRWGNSENGEPRLNSKRQRLLSERSELERQLEIVEKYLEATPKRIRITEIPGKDSFKVIDDEAKNLFDLVRAMVWNARRTLIDMLKKHYQDERDVVNLLDHISRCHGWIKSTTKAVHVRLEPMDMPRFRAAQTEFCQALTQLEARLPNEKTLFFSVGDAPV